MAYRNTESRLTTLRALKGARQPNTLVYANVIEDRLNSASNDWNAWERGRPARLGVLTPALDADGTSALPGVAFPISEVVRTRQSGRKRRQYVTTLGKRST
jgi:hypothetical protein